MPVLAVRRYLAHLSQRYHDLASATFFLHADAPEHILPNLGVLHDLFSAALLGTLSADVGFVYLTLNYIDSGTMGPWDLSLAQCHEVQRIE